MEQLSMFSDSIPFPRDYDDIQQLYEKYIYEGEKDDDVFTWNEIQKGRSYFFYGKKFIEFYPSLKTPYIKVIDRDDNKKYFKITPDSPAQLLEDTLAELKDRKRFIFRNLIDETFGCCNDYRKCSAVGHCIYPEDRFYNGCIYRTNLEAGRNFYKEVSS